MGLLDRPQPRLSPPARGAKQIRQLLIGSIANIEATLSHVADRLQQNDADEVIAELGEDAREAETVCKALQTALATLRPCIGAPNVSGMFSSRASNVEQ